MKNLLTMLLLVLLAVPAYSQETAGAREKIESARIALITERLELTPGQAEKFWPVYREYYTNRQALVREFQDARGNVDRQNLTEEESQRLVALGLSLKEKQVSLERTYAERLAAIISNRQLLALRKAEDDFRQMLLERLQRRREIQQRMQQRRDQIDN